MSRPPRVEGSDPALRALPGARAGAGGEVSGGGGIVGIGGVGSCHGPEEVTGKGDAEQGDGTRRAARRGQLLGGGSGRPGGWRDADGAFARLRVGTRACSGGLLTDWPFGAGLGLLLGLWGGGGPGGGPEAGILTSQLRKVASPNPTCSRFQTRGGGCFPAAAWLLSLMPGPCRGSGST